MLALIKSRKSSLSVRWLGLLLACLGMAEARQVLPVFLSDNHAETAGWITRNFDLDAPHTLVLVDAHSDASAVERSEEMREAMRRVPSEEERARRVENWRMTGRLQAFNWIEPLMPRPLDKVVWMAAPSLESGEFALKTREAAESLDGRLEVEPRSSGSFASRWETKDLLGFHEWQPGGRQIILAIDLDWFAAMAPADRERHFSAIWERAMDWPGLAGVAFSVSRPWLTDDAEADALVSLVIDVVRHTRGAHLELDASVDDRPDDSLKAAESDTEVTRWDFAKASPVLRMKLQSLGKRLSITDRNRNWSVSPWREDAGTARLVPADGEIDCDHVWRYPRGKEPILRVDAPADATGRTRWHLLEPVRDAYDLLPETGLGKAFSASAARWIYEKPRQVAETQDFQLDPATWSRESGGRFLIGAECETPRGWIPAPAIEIRVRTADGFRGSLSECGGMPYVFGIAGVSETDLGGVEAGWGSDCANLLISAWRRHGIGLPWGDPGILRDWLEAIAEDVGVSDHVEISQGQIARGIAIDFGKHVAAVWEDVKPQGILGGNDLVMHHLGGKPEIVALETLAATRPVFTVRMPRSEESCVMKFAGDVVLAEGERTVIGGFERGHADGFVVNLEGIPSMRKPVGKPRYDFRFPPERLDWLKSRGVDAVSLANNHAADAGGEGIIEGIAALRKAGIACFGAGANEVEACRPLRIERKGVQMAIFGVSYFPEGVADSDSAGVAGLPAHRAILEREFRQALELGERIIVMVHGGDEYDARVNDEQHRWARWLVAWGASFIVGAHPHVIQREENYGGAVILHSLGNAVYPSRISSVASGAIRTLDVGRPVPVLRQAGSAR